jgi:predicted nucleotidyltransferase
MTRAIDLSLGERTIVQTILRTHLPPATRVWVFGSRATGTAVRYSDLDLALEGEKPLGPNVLGDVAEALSESDLPYKVDVIDLRSVDPAFRAMIEPEMIALPF